MGPLLAVNVLQGLQATFGKVKNHHTAATADCLIRFRKICGICTAVQAILRRYVATEP